MGRGLRGKNGKEYALTYGENWVISSLLRQLLGKDVNFGAASEHECKEWAALPLLVMWPILIVLYYRLAKREERDMEKEFGQEYVEYRRRTSMFLPLPKF